MKVALNCKPYDGPWGGGNRFVIMLQQALAAAGHVVTHRLDTDTDAVVIIDPRARNPMVTFTAGSILRHLAWRNPRTVVIHRINECDERKGTTGMNYRLRLANYAADHTVFVASWLTDLAVWRRETPSSVIHGGADSRLFHSRGMRPWRGEGPLRLVTHHWGAHESKGFDVYRRLDAMIAEPRWRDRIELSYVGNLPASAGLRNTRLVAPLDGLALADELRRHHAYVTGAVNEPSGNHHIEGAKCGLPILYRRSGALPEYCDEFGVGFDGPEDLEEAMETLIGSYDQLLLRMPSYPFDADRTTSRWLQLIGDLVANRDTIVARRRLWRDPVAVLLNQIPF